ncbi:MAG: hypothetical protein AAF805_03180 [Planctomycetota bacterium]
MNAIAPAADATPPRGPTKSRAPEVAEAWTALAAWAADELGGRLDAAPGRYRLLPRPPDATAGGASPTESAVRRGWFGRRVESQRGLEADTIEAETPLELVDALAARLAAKPDLPAGHPVEQPEAVHDLSARLFAAYLLEGGQAHLAGFHLEDVPLVRLTSVSESDDGAPLVAHRYYDEVGAPIDRGLAASLGLERVASFAERSPRLDDARRERMLASARHADGRPPEGDAPALASIVWAKRASGQLRFEFGDESLDTPFEGWARTLQAPPAVCPQTGVKTYHLATVEGGAIAAADQIDVCCLSGHRRVRGDLAACADTGRLAEPERLAECPITGDRVLPERLKPCRLCDQPVSPPANPEGVCRACRSKRRVSGSDPRVAILLERHAGLRRWGRWRVAETRDVVIAESARGVRCVQWVFSKDGYELIHAVSTLRFASTWRPLSREQRARLLQR